MCFGLLLVPCSAVSGIEQRWQGVVRVLADSASLQSNAIQHRCLL